MSLTRITMLALVAALSLGLFAACSAEDIESKANSALEDAKGKMGDMSLDGFKKQLKDLNLDGIEAKAKEMGKLDIPEVKNMLAKKLDVEKMMEGINAENMMARLKELAPQMKDLGELVKKAKAALGM